MVHAPRTDTAALEKLAAELDARGYVVQLITPADGWPSLAVRHPRMVMLSETVMAEADWFWWPWGDRIAPEAEVPTAADVIIRVLALAPKGDGA